MGKAAQIFTSGRYNSIAVTGGPLDQGAYLKEYRTFAHLGAATLVKLGIPDSVIITIPAPAVSRDRTFTSAVALRDWLKNNGDNIKTIDLASFDAHSRRSALLFRKALGKHYAVGIIALPDGSYDSRNWWRSSVGFRMVIGELIAYVYALVNSGL